MNIFTLQGTESSIQVSLVNVIFVSAQAIALTFFGASIIVLQTTFQNMSGTLNNLNQTVLFLK